MQVILKEDGYVECLTLDGMFENGIEVEAPDDINDFLQNYFVYTLHNGVLKKDLNKLSEVENENSLNELRKLRETECFSIINRGILWYNTLTEEQIDELAQWYQDWLDVTDTMVVPTMPDWIK